MSVDDQIAEIKRQRSEAKAANDYTRVNELSSKLWTLLDKVRLGTAGPSNHEKSNAVVTPPTPQPQVAENIEKQKYSLTETEKRLRNLKKKLRTIEELKAKKQAGSILEDTQLAKIASEKEIADEVKEIEELLATTTTQKL
jgi:translation initiation factor 2A